MSTEQQDIYTKVDKLKCKRLYAFAKDLEARCELCGEKLGDHLTPVALRGVVAMMDSSFMQGLMRAAKHAEEGGWGSDLAAEIRALRDEPR